MILEIVGLVVVLIALNYYWCVTKFRFWEALGVLGPKPTMFIGNIGSSLSGNLSFGQMVGKFYASYKNEPFIGLYFFREPLLLLRDLDLIKDIFISDFSKFPERQLRMFEKSEPLSQDLLHLDYLRWRPLRNKLSPVFTSGKLKEMFQLIAGCGDNLQNYIDKLVEKSSTLDAREVTARFTTDVIGVCAFGLELNAMAEEDSEFRKMGKKAMEMNMKKVILFQLREQIPSVIEFLAPLVRDNVTTDFFINLMKDTMAYRRANNIIRHDFLQYLMEIQDNPESLPEIKLTDSFLASQLFIFFVASFETSSSTMSHFLYEMAQHQDYQDKLRKEIQDTIKANGKLTYDSVKNMKFMDMAFSETLRKYPPVPVLKRGNITEYKFAGTNLTIPKDTGILIPVDAIHHDPKVYPNPEEFNPENFSEEAVASRHPMSFLTFGNGPRNCIGMRFGYQQSKIGLIKILERYRVDVCDKTDIPYKINTRNFMLEPLNGIQLTFIRI